MNNEKITTGNITFPEVEKLLVDTRSELLDTAKRDGKYAGLKNLPGLSDASCAAHLTPFKTLTEQKRSQALSILQPDLHISAIERIDAKRKADESEVKQRKEELEHVNDVDRRELDGKCAPGKVKSNTPGWILTVLNGISDIAFNSAAFEALGDSLGQAIGIAIGVAIATFALAKWITSCMHRASQEGRKWYAAAAGISAIVISGFWVLSEFRANQMAESGVTSTSPISFLLLNLFFFAAAIGIGVLFFPADNQSAGDKNLAQRFAKVEEREKEIEVLKQKLDALNTKAADDRKQHLAILSYTVHTMNCFRSIYFEAVAIWKSTNLLSRPDRSMPSAFSEQVPDLDPLQFNLPPSLNLPTT